VSADGVSAPDAAETTPAGTGAPRERSPLLGEVARLEQSFADSLAARRAAEAAEAILALDRTILDWSADSLQTDDPDRARAVLHSLVHRLGEVASVGLRDPREPLAPLVERLIALRAELRAERAFALADRVRDRLVAAGIELHDTPEGTSWNLRA
jgi:cysteinyl-tRNA synthetase